MWELKKYIIDFIEVCKTILKYGFALYIIVSVLRDCDKNDSFEDEEIEYYQR